MIVLINSTGKINIDEADRDQSNTIENRIQFNNKSKPKTIEGKNKKRNIFDSVNALDELTINAFKSRIFPIKAIEGKGHLSD